MSYPHPVDVDLVLGPLLVATTFNAFIYGLCLLQFAFYWESTRANDIGIIRGLVGWTFLLDTFHTCSLIFMLWNYVIVHFNNPPFLASVLWPFSATPIVTTLTSFPIQIYLSWRIRQFSHATKVFYALSVLAVAQASLGFTCSISAFQIPEIGSYSKLVPFVSAWLISAVATDVSITVLLIWYLSRSRTGRKSSDHVITRLIRASIETAAFGAFFCIMDLITFTLWPETNFHVIFSFPMGRVYTNTLLMTLNSRKSLRAELERPVTSPDIVLDQSTQIGISPGVANTGPVTPTLFQMTSEQHSSMRLNLTVYNTGGISEVPVSSIPIFRTTNTLGKDQRSQEIEESIGTG